MYRRNNKTGIFESCIQKQFCILDPARRKSEREENKGQQKNIKKE